MAVTESKGDGFALYNGVKVLASEVPDGAESIPLDGMNVIEWDGDTTGLDAFGDFYRVTSSVPSKSEMTNAIAVFSDGGNLASLQITQVDEELGCYVPLAQYNGSEEPVGYIIPSEATAELGLPSGTYLVHVLLDEYDIYTTLLAYTPATTEEPETPTVKKFPLRQFILGLLSELTAGSAKEPIAYLYNGVRLPKLPEWNRGVYPFATISIISTMTALTVTLTFRKSWKQDVQLDIPKDAIWTQPGDIEYKIKKSGYYLSIDSVKDAEWGEATECTEAEWMSATNIRWTNKDIVSQGSIDHETGELILAASEPVPVYE